MSRALTPIEIDFLRDLCGDDLQIWQAFDFVRVHDKYLSDEEVFQSGKKLLLDWLRQGWIEIIETKDGREKMQAGSLVKFFEQTGISLMTQFDSTVWMEITTKGEEAFASSKPAKP